MVQNPFSRVLFFALILLGKSFSKLSKIARIGAGGTWPGEIALSLQPHILSLFFARVESGIVLIVGTNGKTTTSKMVQEILSNTQRKEYVHIVHNDTGANLVNGVISACIQSWNFRDDPDYAVLEIDEASFPLISKELEKYKGPVAVAFLNLFRDQLDRYGEVRTIALMWKEALRDLPEQTLFVTNADDPELVEVTSGKKNLYFGMSDKSKFLKLKEHATDSTYCPRCGAKLAYEGVYFSHLGIWRCDACGNTRPALQLDAYPSALPGLYNLYNTFAAVLVSRAVGISDSQIKKTLTHFVPAFGRQEELTRNGKSIKIFLAKNPAGCNATLRTVLELKAKHILFLLNDRVPDGRDVSWIWDVDFEMIPGTVHLAVSGDRAYDLGLRIKYTMNQCGSGAMKQVKIFEKTKEAIDYALERMDQDETLYIIPTYTAMLEARKILTGRKIL